MTASGSSARLRHRDMGLERQMQTLLSLERVLEDAMRVGERFVGVAAPQVIIERHIGALAALQMF